MIRRRKGYLTPAAPPPPARRILRGCVGRRYIDRSGAPTEADWRAMEWFASKPAALTSEDYRAFRLTDDQGEPTT
jgi:hypothetical protein